MCTDVKEWYDKNQLVNTSKSNINIVSSRRHVITNDNNVDVLLSDEILTQVDCFSYLGVTLDAHLTCNEQVARSLFLWCQDYAA